MIGYGPIWRVVLRESVQTAARKSCVNNASRRMFVELSRDCCCGECVESRDIREVHPDRNQSVILGVLSGRRSILGAKRHTWEKVGRTTYIRKGGGGGVEKCKAGIQ